MTRTENNQLAQQAYNTSRHIDVRLESEWTSTEDNRVRVTQGNFIQGGSAPRSNPLPLYIPLLTEKVPLLKYLLLKDGTSLTYLV